MISSYQFVWQIVAVVVATVAIVCYRIYFRMVRLFGHKFTGHCLNLSNIIRYFFAHRNIIYIAFFSFNSSEVLHTAKTNIDIHFINPEIDWSEVLHSAKTNNDKIYIEFLNGLDHRAFSHLV